MYLNTSGKSTEKTLNEEADFNSATNYGIAKGITEGAIEGISGGIGGATSN